MKGLLTLFAGFYFFICLGASVHSEEMSSVYYFDAEFYLQKYADLNEAFEGNHEAALIHWMTDGLSEGRQGSPYFDIRYYLDNYSDLKQEFGSDYKSAFYHWINNGIYEGRSGSPNFDPTFYLAKYPDLQQAFQNNYHAAFIQWVNIGIFEGRQASFNFDPTSYMQRYFSLEIDIGYSYRAALEHWLLYGENEGRLGEEMQDVYEQNGNIWSYIENQNKEPIGTIAGTSCFEGESPWSVSSRPEGVLDQNSLLEFWNSTANAPDCDIAMNSFSWPECAADENDTSTYDVSELTNSSIFSSTPSYDYCNTIEPYNDGNITAPAPIIDLNLDETYGVISNLQDISAWFHYKTSMARIDNQSQFDLAQTLIMWAEAPSLNSGLNTSWGSVHYDVLITVQALLSAFTVTYPTFNPDELNTVHNWLSKLVNAVEASHFNSRQDNKAFTKLYIKTLWAALHQDQDSLKKSVDRYKLAIHDMRPDGTWPVDASRGGMGLNYQSNSTGSLFMTGYLLEKVLGQKFLNYSTDKRSIHSAFSFILNSIAAPGTYNSIYAKSCPSSGNLFGTTEDPSMSWSEIDDVQGPVSSFFGLYAHRFPNHPNTRLILKKPGGLPEIPARIPRSCA